MSKEIKDLNKVIVYIDYIDRDFFNVYYRENWIYNDIDFYVYTNTITKKGILKLDYEGKKLYNFELYIGTEDNFFIVDKKEVRIFKDLENIVYNNENNKKKKLSKYLCNGYIKNVKYYFVSFDRIILKYFLNYHILDFDSIDKRFFEIGNMFNSKEEAEKYVNMLNSNNLTLNEFKKKDKNFLKIMCLNSIN